MWLWLAAAASAIVGLMAGALVAVRRRQPVVETDALVACAVVARLQANMDALFLENLELRSRFQGMLVNATLLRFALRRFVTARGLAWTTERDAWACLAREVTASRGPSVDGPCYWLVRRSVQLMGCGATTTGVVGRLLDPSELFDELARKPDGYIPERPGLHVGGNHLCVNCCAALACGLALVQRSGALPLTCSLRVVHHRVQFGIYNGQFVVRTAENDAA